MNVAAHSSFTEQSMAARNRYLEARVMHLQSELDAARRLIAEHGSSDAKAFAIVDKMARFFALKTGIGMNDIKGGGRTRKITLVRAAIMYWARRRTDLSLRQIANALNVSSHQSCWYAVTHYPARRAAMGRHLRPLDTRRGN